MLIMRAMPRWIKMRRAKVVGAAAEQRPERSPLAHSCGIVRSGGASSGSPPDRLRVPAMGIRTTTRSFHGSTSRLYRQPSRVTLRSHSEMGSPSSEAQLSGRLESFAPLRTLRGYPFPQSSTLLCDHPASSGTRVAEWRRLSQSGFATVTSVVGARARPGLRA